MAAASSGQRHSYSRGDVEFLYHHVFLPPQVPQSDDYSSERDLALLRVTQEAATALKNLAPLDYLDTTEKIVAMLATMQKVHSDGPIHEKALLQAFGELIKKGTPLALHIRAQNAGVLLSHVEGEIRIAVFELSPTNLAAMSTIGRLQRSFPAASIAVKLNDFKQAEFQHVLAQTLSTMSSDAVESMQPKIRKAAELHIEDRDTSRPSLVTELLMGFLAAVGEPFVSLAIVKNTREEVRWLDARSPWRRSSTWLLTRVAVQFIMVQDKVPSKVYKELLLLLMCDIERLALGAEFESDALYVMNAKVAQRVKKLGHTIDWDIFQRIHRAVTATHEEISKRWKRIQQNDSRTLDLSSLSKLDFEADTLVALPKLNDYIYAMKMRTPQQRSAKRIESHALLRFSAEHLPSLANQHYFKDEVYAIANLQSFEEWVSLHCQTWAQNCTVASVSKTTADLVDLIKDYHQFAQRYYAGNPEALSIMMLTIFELWMACDKGVASMIPLLREYEPGINRNILQNLLLPRRYQMDRLRAVETYLNGRIAHASRSHDRLFSMSAPDSFAAKYFDGSREHQETHDNIIAAAERDQKLKKTEFEVKQKEFKYLMSRYENEDCQYYDYCVDELNNFWEKRHKRFCSRCGLKKQALQMQVLVHEWPLPSNQVKAKAVVFELNVPSIFAAWREATLYFIDDVLKTRSRTDSPRSKYVLSSDAQLAKFMRTSAKHSRCKLLSQEKPHIGTHRNMRQLSTATASQICLNTGLNYQYFDDTAGEFIGAPQSSDGPAKNLTYRLPDKAKVLQKYLSRPASAQDGPPPNSVVAGQSECPSHMILEEFKDLAAVAVGHRIQWYNIMLQLCAPTIDFKKDETALIVFQCIYQTGPPSLSNNPLRSAHVILEDNEFATKLLDSLAGALSRVKENWESAQAIAVFSTIIGRLLSVTRTVLIQQRCIEILKEIRNVLFRWVELLCARAQRARSHEDRKELKSRSVDIALICGLSLDVDDNFLADLLASTKNASVLIQCSIIVQEGKPNYAKSTDPVLHLLLHRFRLLLGRASCMLCELNDGLDDAVNNAWPAYQPGRRWIVLDDENGHENHWTWTRTFISGHSVFLTVHYNTLTGELLVDGLPLDRPPREYEEQPQWDLLFGNSVIEVMPTVRPGMHFSLKQRFMGHEVHVGLDQSSGATDLLIFARKEGKSYTTVPPRLLEGQFPRSFIRDYVHWYNHDNGVVEFRPRQDPWARSHTTMWTLAKSETLRWCLKNQSNTLIYLKSTTSKMLADILSPLAEATRIHTTLSPFGKSISIDIPTLQLGFTLGRRESSLQSRDFRGMYVDEDQSLSTMTGFSNKFLLKPEGIGQRIVLLPEGSVSCSISGGHVEAKTDRSCIKKVHSLHVDQLLGRLVDNGDLQCKLMQARIHSVTSFCLPDMLTKMTGTEKCLSILRSAAVGSFDQLSQDNVRALEAIAALTPRRSYYPASERVMQSVKFSTQTSFLAQHNGIAEAVEAIFRQAQESSVFHEESVSFPDPLKSIDRKLLRRDQIRASTFRTSAFGAEDFSTSKDMTYQARDSSQQSEMAVDARILSTMVHQNKTSAHWKHDDECLWTESKATGMHGLSDEDVGPPFKFDSQSIGSGMRFEQWLAIHSALQSKNRPSKFNLMMWLSTLAAYEQANLPILQAIALMHTTQSIRNIAIPDVETCFPASGHFVEKSEVARLVRSSSVELSMAPEANLLAHGHEDRWTFEARRDRLFEGNRESSIAVLTDRLHSQWPTIEAKVPDLSDLEVKPEDYLRMASAMESVNKLFRSSYNNLRLFHYLGLLDTALSSLATQTVSVASWPSIVMKKPAKNTRFISVSDIRDYDAPVLPTSNDGFALPISVQSSGMQSVRLSKLLEGLQSSSTSAFDSHYLEELRASIKSLEEGSSIPSVDVDTNFSTVQLGEHRNRCMQRLNDLHERIRASFLQLVKETPGNTISYACSQWPRTSPTFLLQFLNRLHWSKLSQDHKASIVSYGLAITEVQRADRMLKASISAKKEDLVSEVLNSGHTNWDPHEAPESLLLEIESGITIRAVQEEIAGEMRSPPKAQNAVMQLNMGEGKSSTIVPMVAAALADSSQLVRVIVAKPQSKQMLQMLVSKLGGLIGRRVRQMPFSRALKLDKAGAEVVRAIVQDCMDSGDILLIQPEHILSFRLMVLESASSESTEEVGHSLLSTQSFLEEKSRDIVDESDENFSTKFELIYTMGSQRAIEFSPNRWRCIQEVLELVRRLAPKVKENVPDGVELQDCVQGGRFSRLRLLKSEAADLLVALIAEHICEIGVEGLPITRQSKRVRNAVRSYLMDADTSDEIIQKVEGKADDSLWQSSSARSYLLLLRGLLAGGILAFVLGQKRWRVNYGLAPDRQPRTRLAVPYRAKDNPTPRSEFSHPDVVLALTCLTYYYDGLEEADLFTAFEQLFRADQADVEYETWMKDSPSMPSAFRNLQGINIRDRLQCITEVFPHLRHSKSVVDFFLSHIVFPKEVKEFPHKLSASGWDIGMVKSRPTTGFSGTNDSKTLLPLDVAHLDLPRQQHTNALVLMHILNPNNSVHLMKGAAATGVSDAEYLLSTVVQQNPSTQVILDVGAQILELDNRGVAQRWLELYSSKQHPKDDPVKKRAVVFVNEADELSVLDGSGRVEPLQTSSYSSRLDECFVFLDEAHTRGTDLKLPKYYRAAVTLGANLTKDRLAQACMRMRQLGKGQTVVFCVNAEIEGKIRALTSKVHDEAIEVAEVLRWAISETFTETRRAMPLWAAQGERFLRQQQYWDGIVASGISQEQARKFLEPESQTLEYRYRPRPTNDTLHGPSKSRVNRMDEIRERCALFDDLQYNASILQEEQERELSPEIEQETQIELPASAKSAPHQLHPDVSSFVSTGQVNSASKAYMPAFKALEETMAAKGFSTQRLDGDKHLLVTADFAKTIKTGLVCKTDSYQRSVQWILATRFNGTGAYLMIISPYEAEKLIADIRASTKVGLHLYKPRCNISFREFDHLDFLSIPANVTTQNIPRPLLLRLDIFAGQLYLDSYEDYLQVCELLGLAAHVPQQGQVIAADGFILQDVKGKKTRGASPVKFLQALMSQIRRNGQGISKTDMGYILEGKLLEASHFEGRGSGAA